MHTFQNIIHLDFEESTDCTGKILKLIAKSYSNLEYLNISTLPESIESENDIDLSAIAQSCHKLEYLNISCHTEIIEISICDIIYSCPRLQHLEFSYCKFTNEIIKEIASSCLNLKYLKLEGCDVSKEALVSLNPNFHVENFVCTITPPSLCEYPGMYVVSRRLRMSVDAPRDIKSIHEYVNDELRRMEGNLIQNTDHQPGQ